MRETSVALLMLTALSLIALACRPGDPVIDPKTPVNSPVPKLERPDDTSVRPDGGDGR